MLGKAIVISGVARLFRSSPGHAVATGVCLAQAGEFSFMLAEVARHGQLINGGLFELMVAATVGTLFLTPYLVALAPHLARAVDRFSKDGLRPLHAMEEAAGPSDTRLSGHIVIVGFGPAGQRVAEALMRLNKSLLVVIELNSKSADVARTYGLRTYLGDATRAEVLEHVRVAAAAAVVVTVPDRGAARHVIEQVRSLSPETPVIARARYHVYRWELILAGAEVVVDEEEEVGLRIAAAVRKMLRATGSEPQSENGTK